MRSEQGRALQDRKGEDRGELSGEREERREKGQGGIENNIVNPNNTVCRVGETGESEAGKRYGGVHKMHAINPDE